MNISRDDGWVLVPRIPTREMLEAGAVGCGEDSEACALGAWEAMIEVAEAANKLTGESDGQNHS